MKENAKKEDKKPVDRGAEGFHKWASGARKPTKEEEEFAQSIHPATPYRSMEEQFDKQSKENYERLDREVMDAIKETDKYLPKDLDKYEPLKATERKKLRELMGRQERLLVWMFRIAFLTFMYMYWHVTDVRIRRNTERMQELEEKVELLNEMLNPTEAPEESNHWMLCNGTDTMLAKR